MEKRKFYTLIKADHKLGKDSYVKGRISGLMEALCNENPGKDILFGRGGTELGEIHTVETTNERYKKFVEVVELEYPNLCEFDYKRVI